MKSSTIVHLLGVARAHTIMQSFNGNPQGAGIYMPSDDSFISDVNSNSIACNGPPVTSFRSSSQVFEVKAGSQVTGAWLHTLSSTGPDSTADNKVIDSSHKGPISVWMKKVSDATQNPSAGPGGGWFRIAEEGLNNGKWGVDTLIASGGIHKATIPTCIEDGNYLLRFELIALHSAYDQGGAQFYMECAQIRVTGGTGTGKPATVSLPGAYKATDPGIKVMIYNNDGQPYPSSYTIPGNGSSGSGSSGSSGGSSGSGGSASGQTLYGQCGGNGWTGPTTCASGTCKKSNDYYSQCLP
ncbi:glycosyl hydrolase family 61-domain-containing protein [Parachaetomium inaequale]|uniref:lytic cellulose monooxygenase (C4-dehydrogenating) n=1 Tax=Parachaetomium inaequale TaxID=2588326 RepID=A0AAN6SMM1_9PEZI|nr:glycosyl hydrolase family 61-domain-containing protein [Parachaetomium inaequale]